ncbi:phage protein [Staphylococcus aureus]|nr:phage protein [Staphylococcus aureus]
MARKARIVTINDKPYRFSKFEMELIESHGITAGMVSKRVKDGCYMKQWTHQKVRV